METKSKSIALILVVLFLTSLVTVASATSADTKTNWNVQTVDSNSSQGYIAIDSNNIPHIAYSHNYYNQGDNLWYLMYASWNGSSWDKQNVTTYPCSPLGLGFDTYNNPHILCRREGFGLIYASWNGSNWNFQTIDKLGLTGSLALDSFGNPHVAYLSNNNGFGNPLKYATSDGVGWSFQTITSEKTDAAQSTNDYIGLLQIALDSNNNPRIMYERFINNYHLQQTTSSRIEYAMWNNISKTWNFPTVLSNITLERMALDSNGFPHFTYIGEEPTVGNTTLRYASWNGTIWTKQPIATINNQYTYCILTLDSDNNPHVTYRNSENLIYASWTGTKWINQTVTSVSFFSVLSSTAIEGNPHLVYVDNPNNPIGRSSQPFYLMYATSTQSIVSEPSKTPIPSILVTVQTMAVIIVVSIVVVVVLSLLFYRMHRRTISQNKPTFREKSIN